MEVICTCYVGWEWLLNGCFMGASKYDVVICCLMFANGLIVAWYWLTLVNDGIFNGIPSRTQMWLAGKSAVIPGKIYVINGICSIATFDCQRVASYKRLESNQWQPFLETFGDSCGSFQYSTQRMDWARQCHPSVQLDTARSIWKWIWLIH